MGRQTSYGNNGVEKKTVRANVGAQLLPNQPHVAGQALEALVRQMRS